MNGCTYKINDEFVVKVPHKERRKVDSIIKETLNLDLLYNFFKERKVNWQNSQRGIAAIYNDDGEGYLISTFVPGGECGKTIDLNSKNLNSVMQIITELDIGTKDNGRLMSYDYNTHNIHYTETTAVIYDFENLKCLKLEDEILKRVVNGRKSNTPHLSDTSALTSNIRTFEFGTIYHYTKKLKPEERKNFFKKYLHEKSIYHNKMAKYYEKEAKGNIHGAFLSKLAKKENVHSELLNINRITDDIIKSEAIKIQLAVFIYHFNNGKIRKEINPKQITLYYKESLKFFKDKLHNAIKSRNKNEAIYYFDCVNALEIWGNLSKINSFKYDKTKVHNEFEKTFEKYLNY